MLETYITSRQTEKGLQEYWATIHNQMKALRKLFPHVENHTMAIMSGYVSTGAFCTDKYPEVDIKVVFDSFFQNLATDPELKGIYGTGCYSIAGTDEETLRWIGKLMRHYCVEGKTNSLAKQYGFKLKPGILHDGDFENQFAFWNAIPAEPGSLVVKKISGYGIKTQERIGGGSGLGDNVALFTRSAKKPNLLSQTVSGLIPGKLYCLKFSSCDYEDIFKHKHMPLDCTLDATISDVEILPEVSTTRRFPTIWDWKHKTGRSNQPEHVLRRIVFRAKKDTATVTFSDWKTPTEPGGPAGVRRVVNWISINPYFQN